MENQHMTLEELKELKFDVIGEIQSLQRSWDGCVEMYRKTIKSPEQGQKVRVSGTHIDAGSFVEFEKVVVVFQLTDKEPTVVFQCKNEKLGISEYYHMENIVWEE